MENSQKHKIEDPYYDIEGLELLPIPACDGNNSIVKNKDAILSFGEGSDEQFEKLEFHVKPTEELRITVEKTPASKNVPPFFFTESQIIAFEKTNRSKLLLLHFYFELPFKRGDEVFFARVNC